MKSGVNTLTMVIGMVMVVLGFLFLNSISFLFPSDVITILYSLLFAGFAVVALLSFF